jgi:xylulokinase
VSADDLCLSIDLGTGGPKVGLVTLDGDVLAYELHAVETRFARDGAATQDPDEWWSLIVQSTKRLMGRPDVEKSRVKAVAVTGQYGSTVPVDANGVPTGPCLTWLDTRGGPFSRRAFGGPIQGYSARKVQKFVRKTAGAPLTSGGDPVGQILYLMNEEPDLVARTRWFMEPVDYLTMRFTGVASATHASRFATWITDNRRLTHFDYDPELLAMVGIDEKRMPPLLPIGAIVGSVAPSVATDLGLSDETVVITGLLDLHTAALGSGGTGFYDTHLALSTTSWISCPVPKKKTDINHSIATAPGLTNDSYLIIDNQDTGAKSLDWLRGVLAGAAPPMSYPEMTALAATSPPGANGVLFTPWLAGVLSPVANSKIRAGFTNLSITTDTADLIRAVLEGVAANSAWLFAYVERFTGQKLSPIRLVGGGAQSRLWCQIYADALDRQIEQVPEPMVAQLRGAALMASVSLGRHGLAEIATLRPRGSIFEPDPAVRDLYRARRDEFPELYRRDKKWSRRGGAKTKH